MNAVATTSSLPAAAPFQAKFAWPRRVVASVLGGARWSAGLGVTVVLLAVAAAVPVLNVAVLGYMLEVEGRIVRGVPLADAFPLLRRATRIGAALVLTWAWLLPVRLVASLAEDASWIAPGSPAQAWWSAFRAALAVLVGLHLFAVLARGARARDFFHPLASVRWMAVALRGRAELQGLDALRDAWAEVPWRQLFWKGAAGLLGATAWLAVPVGLLWLSRTGVPKPGVSMLGIALLLPVLAWLPFIQARFAVEGKPRAYLDWRGARRLTANAPASALLAQAVLYALSLPLYLLTIVLPPRDAMWLATLFFVAALLPGRVAVALAYRRATRLDRPAGALLRWTCRLLGAALILAVAVMLFLTPLIDHRGAAGLFSQHAFALPVPF